MLRTRILFNLSLLLTIVLLFFYLFSMIDKTSIRGNIRFPPRFQMNFVNVTQPTEKAIKLDMDYNLWLIFTKVVDKSPLMYNFKNLMLNLLNVSSVPLKFHIIVDEESKKYATREIDKVSNLTGIIVDFKYYNVGVLAKEMEDIVSAMTPHFSSRPGTYYSDVLFYLSLGLYRVAGNQSKAVMLDCDIFFKDDVLLLFQQFDKFDEGNLFGLAPELSPVYKHILYNYKQESTNSTFGEYYHSMNISEGVHPRGFQGYNSGVLLMNFIAIRNSSEYQNVIKKDSVKRIVQKYKFKGHLGDQDFYTVLGYEKPHLIHTMNCGFNRQLCTWWRDSGGYKDIFEDYFKCNHKVVVLHGNCLTKIPR